MAPPDLPALIDEIRRRHSCEASFLESVPVLLTLEDGREWRGEVHVFDVSGHPLALRCYAWREGGPGDEGRVCTVLGFPPVTSAAEAVRAALAEGKGEPRG
jgi:hypothetical protein